MKAIYTLIFVLMAGTAYGQSNLPACPALDNSQVGFKRTKNWNNCFGTYAHGDGRVYGGAYKNGIPNGQGSSTFANGDRHVGEYKDGVRHGQGTYTFANGEKYVGEYMDGKYNGQGTFTFINGNKSVGEWRDDKFNGQGIVYSADGSVKQSGIYKDNVLVTSQYIDPNSFTRIARNNSAPAVSDSQRQIIEKKAGLQNRVEIAKFEVTPYVENDIHPNFANLYVPFDQLLKSELSKYIDSQGMAYKFSEDTKPIKLNVFVAAYQAKNTFGVFSMRLNIRFTYEIFDISTSFDVNVSSEASPLEKLLGTDRYKVLTDRILNQVFDKFQKQTDSLYAEVMFEKIKSNERNFQLQAIKNMEQLDEKNQLIKEEKRIVDEDNRQLDQSKSNQRITLQINNSQPNADGDVSINIETNADTASLKINGEEQGGRADGKYSVKRVARAGQETRFEIIAKDVYGNSDTKTISVSRTVVESKVTYQQLNPDRIKRQPERDAVAVIIGISNYKSLPKAEFAKDDAQVFYDYAIRALGVKPGNIKLLMDEQADAEEIYTAFKTWLPARVKSTTEVYVFYSGHGLPTQDGSGLYWLPQRANRDLISKTGILLSEVNSDIQASKPKSVTIFMDACYSGQARGGETLVASARPIALKSQPVTFPSNFTVISASQADQISSSSPELQHGIFSYYLMKGMEGEADLNKDGKITLNETQAYLSENVGRHARIMNRQQEPQVIGDGARVLVGR